jgi:hypothetical protein
MTRQCAHLSTISPLSTGPKAQIPFARLRLRSHSDLSRSGGTNRKREETPKRRQCRKGRDPSGRKPRTLWWGSREEARGSGETQSRTHFSGVRRNLSLRAKEYAKGRPESLLEGRPEGNQRVRPERNGRSGYRVRPVEKSRKGQSPACRKDVPGWSPACRKDVRTDGSRACLADVRGIRRSLLRLISDRGRPELASEELDWEPTGVARPRPEPTNGAGGDTGPVLHLEHRAVDAAPARRRGLWPMPGRHALRPHMQRRTQDRQRLPDPARFTLLPLKRR